MYKQDDEFNKNFDKEFLSTSNQPNGTYSYGDQQYNDNQYNNNQYNNNSWNYTPNTPKKSKESKPITLTRKKFALIIVLVVVLAFGGAFSGMYAYNSLYPSADGHKSAGSIKGDGYTLTGATGSPMTVDEIVDKNLATVVQIRTESVSSDFWVGEYVTEGAGSGVIIKENGYIVTNNHVIDGASNIYVTLSNNKEYEAKLIGADKENDLAVIKINAKGLPAATYGNSDELTVGNLSVIIGNPLG